MAVKVAKFGGSSVADVIQLRKIKEIIKSDPERRYIVVSAPGKRFSDDIKVTDMLYKCYEIASKDEDFGEIFEKICQRYNEIISELSLDLSLEDEYKKMWTDFKNHMGRDYAASRGEYLNGIILAKYLGYKFIDAAKVIHFDEKGNYDFEVLEAVDLKLAEIDEKCVFESDGYFSEYGVANPFVMEKRPIPMIYPGEETVLKPVKSGDGFVEYDAVDSFAGNVLYFGRMYYRFG